MMFYIDRVQVSKCRDSPERVHVVCLLIRLQGAGLHEPTADVLQPKSNPDNSSEEIQAWNSVKLLSQKLAHTANFWHFQRLYQSCKSKCKIVINKHMIYRKIKEAGNLTKKGPMIFFLSISAFTFFSLLYFISNIIVS